MLAVLAAAGLPPQVCAYALDTLTLYVTGVVAEEAIRARQGEDPDRGKEEFLTRVHTYYQALPPSASRCSPA